MKLGGKMSRSPSYVIKMTRTDLTCLGESGGGAGEVNSEK